ncbi:hypothetical protein Bbelb_186430 [Branchiostoma belcheri]|nr:hypothetical protein Bbelb_186430 [Branchiostoma belcheri]
MNQSNRGENNPKYDLKKLTSPGQNEDNLRSDQDALHTESVAEPATASTCGQNCSHQGQDMLEATYVVGEEVEPTTTDEHYYIAPSSQGEDMLEATYVVGEEVEPTTTDEHYYIAPSSQGEDMLDATYVVGEEVEPTTTDEHYYIAPSSQGGDMLEATYVVGEEVEPTTTDEHYYIAPSSQGGDMLEATYVVSEEVEHTSKDEHYYMAPSSQGEDMLEATYVVSVEVEHTSTNEHYYMASSSQEEDMLAATYVAGNEVEHTTTNEHYYMADNNDIPTPAVAEVYSASDPIHAETSAIYTASRENEEDGNTTGNSAEEQQVMQADSTVTMNFNSNRKANKSQPHTTQDKGYNETRHRRIKPYTFKIIKKGRSQETDNGDIEPYAVANMSDHMAYLSRTINTRQKASDDSTHDTTVHKLRNPANTDSKATDDGDIEPYAVTNMCENETYLSTTTNVHQQASDDSRSDTTEHVKKLRNPPKATRLLPNPMYTSNPQQADKLCVKRSCLLIALVVFLLLVGAITTGVIIGVYHNTPGIQKTKQEVNNLSTLNATELTHVATIRITDSTNSSSLGGINGTTPSSLGTTDGTTPPSLGTTDGTSLPSYTTEVKKNFTFCRDGGKGKGPGQFCSVRGLAVSSTNEIFAADRTLIQVFSMEGVYLRNFSTPYMKQPKMCIGSNDTLWITLYAPYIRQYSKEGHVLAEFKCNSVIFGIGWQELSDRTILAIRALRQPKELEIVWLSPTYSPPRTCKINWVNWWLSATTASYNYRSVTVDTKGNIYILNMRGACILKYDKNGVYLFTFGTKGTETGNLNYPTGICVDSLGRVIVADSGNNRVEMFTAEGKHIRTIAYIKQPVHVAIGGEGQLVVSHQYYFITIFEIPKY